MIKVTLEELKLALRVDDDIDDPTLQLYLDAAHSAVARYINVPVDEPDSDSGEPDAYAYPYDKVTQGDDPVIKRAVIALVDSFFDGSNGRKEFETDGLYLPPATKSLLLPLRKPTAV